MSTPSAKAHTVSGKFFILTSRFHFARRLPQHPLTQRQIAG
jgi:hypothetical protein